MRGLADHDAQWYSDNQGRSVFFYFAKCLNRVRSALRVCALVWKRVSSNEVSVPHNHFHHCLAHSGSGSQCTASHRSVRLIRHRSFQRWHGLTFSRYSTRPLTRHDCQFIQVELSIKLYLGALRNGALVRIRYTTEQYYKPRISCYIQE